MLSQELKAQIFKLPPSDRLARISAIVESLQDTTAAQPDCSSAIRRMRGLLQTEQPAPTVLSIQELLQQVRQQNGA